MADGDRGVSRRAEPVAPARFSAISGLLVHVEPIVRSGREVGGQISVRSRRPGMVVPARLTSDGVLHGLPVPAGPTGPEAGEWTVSTVVSDVPSSAVRVGSLTGDRSPTIEVMIAPDAVEHDERNGIVRWRELWLHVVAEWHSTTQSVRTRFDPVPLHRLIVGMPEMAIFTTDDAAPVVVIEPRTKLRTAADAQRAVTGVRDALIDVGAEPTAIRILDEILELLRPGAHRWPATAVVTDHATAVLPRATRAAAVLGTPGSELHIVPPIASGHRAVGLVITIAAGGMTVVRDLCMERPSSTPVQHVRVVDLPAPWLADFAPLLRFVRRDPGDGPRS